jgi:hypothetical protein
MTLSELFTIITVLLGLTILRFGLPLFLMWLLNLVYYRVLHLSE